MEPSKHELTQFMERASQQMADDYDMIRQRSKEDPGTAGDQGEENWATLFRQWLSPTYQVVTKGRILSHDGTASPQVDVLVLNPAYPKALLNSKLFLADGVVAAFECKVTLRSGHIREAIENTILIHKCSRQDIGNPKAELFSPIIYGLLAHSHEKQGDKNVIAQSITTDLLASDAKFVKHPREMLDFVCVANLAAWIVMKTAWIGPHALLLDRYGPEGTATTGYVCFNRFAGGSNVAPSPFTPIGSLLTHLLSRIAWDDKDVRKLSSYFSASGQGGSGLGYDRKWAKDIYSPLIRDRIPSALVGDPWSDWRQIFM